MKDIFGSPDFIQRISAYDPYTLPSKTESNPLAQTIKSPKGFHGIESEKSQK